MEEMKYSWQEKNMEGKEDEETNQTELLDTTRYGDYKVQKRWFGFENLRLYSRQRKDAQSQGISSRPMLRTSRPMK